MKSVPLLFRWTSYESCCSQRVFAFNEDEPQKIANGNCGNVGRRCQYLLPPSKYGWLNLNVASRKRYEKYWKATQNEQNVNAVETIFMNDRKITLGHIAEVVGVSVGSVKTIIKQHLWMSKAAA